jgi:hypothetical protein
MSSQCAPLADAGRDQRLAGLRRSLHVALAAPSARDSSPTSRRALVRSVAGPQLDAAVTAGALGEQEARWLLSALEQRYAARERPLAAAG